MRGEVGHEMGEESERLGTRCWLADQPPVVISCNLGGSWLAMLGAALRRTEVTRPDGSCNTCMCHNPCRQPPESTQEGKTSRARHDHQNHQKHHRQTEHTQPSKPAADPLGLS